MKSFRQSDFYHTWFKPCKGGRLQAGGEAKRNPCYKCDDEFHSAKGTTENTGNLFCRPYRLCFICVYQMQGLRTSFVKLVINLTIFPITTASSILQYRVEHYGILLASPMKY